MVDHDRQRRERAVVEVLALEIDEVEFVGDHHPGDMRGEFGIALDRRDVARPAAFVGRAVAFADAQREVAVVVEERGHVVVVDIDQHVGRLVAKPLPGPARSLRRSASTPGRRSSSRPWRRRWWACAKWRCRRRSWPCLCGLDPLARRAVRRGPRNVRGPHATCAACGPDHFSFALRQRAIRPPAACVQLRCLETAEVILNIEI